MGCSYGGDPAFHQVVPYILTDMSSLWTPDGERPIRRESPGSSQPPPEMEDAGFAEFDERDQPTPEEMRAMQEELRAMTEELVQVPAAAVVANHCIGFFQLAAAHLQTDPPNLIDAQVAIDALAAVVDGLRGRLGPDESTIVEALAQIRLAYVQVSGAFRQ